MKTRVMKNLETNKFYVEYFGYRFNVYGRSKEKHWQVHKYYDDALEAKKVAEIKASGISTAVVYEYGTDE